MDLKQARQSYQGAGVACGKRSRWCILPGMVVAAVIVGACRPKPAPEPGLGESAEHDSRIEFPADVQAQDPAVNAFVRKVLECCARGDYEPFRLLWAVRQTPYPRDEFRRGWKALKKLRVVALQKMRTKQGEFLYYVHLRVWLDPSVPEPEREVGLLLIQETGSWRLAQAPAHVFKQYAKKPAEGDAPTSAPTTTSTSGQTRTQPSAPPRP